MPNENPNLTAQMTDHILDPVRGPQVGHRLEYYAPKAANKTWYRGACISATNNGQLQPGCPAGSAFNRPMPMFALQSTFDLDVWDDSETPEETGMGAPSGVPSALVASGGFELATTEFEYISSDTAVVYNVNDQLTADATTGKLKKKTAATEPTVGIVSIQRNGNVKKNSIDIPIQNRWNHPMLTFWTFFIPAADE